MCSLDTIKIRFHGINDFKTDTLTLIRNEANNLKQTPVVAVHNELYLRMVEKKHKSFSITTTVNREVESNEEMTMEEFNHLENSKNLSYHYVNRDKVRFRCGLKEREINKSINGKYHLPSSESGVTFTINENGSFVDFEFSIPKYLYGHNLAQFVPQINSNRFNKRFHEWDWQVKNLYPRLMKFIDLFLNDLGTYFQLSDVPDKNYIEIRRIDLCYNQYFEDRAKALEVFNQLTKINKKKRRVNANIALQYDTTLTYLSSSGSYFKIYHKGTEYARPGGKDLKRHMEANVEFMDKCEIPKKDYEVYKKHRELIIKLFEQKVKGNDIIIDEEIRRLIKPLVNYLHKNLPYKVDFLKSEMDKILRYEISLSGDFFKYCYKMRVFRKKCSHHQEAVKAYKKVKSIYTAKSKNDLKVPKKYRDLHKHMHGYFSNAIHLVLSDKKMLQRFETYGGIDYNALEEKYRITRYGYRYTILSNKDIGIFSEDFLKECCKHFKAVVNEYQIKELDKFEDIRTKIIAYNDAVKEKRDRFNEKYKLQCFDTYGNRKRKGGIKAYNERGEPIIVGGKEIKNAVDLLTQTQLRNKQLKKVNVHTLMHIVKDIEGGMSFDNIVKKMKVPKATKYRWEKDLEMFGVFKNTLEMNETIEMKTDYHQYYWTTDGTFYQDSFFTEKSHSRIG